MADLSIRAGTSWSEQARPRRNCVRPPLATTMTSNGTPRGSANCDLPSASATTAAEIIILPVICIARSDVDLACQRWSRAQIGRNIVDFWRVRLRRALERLNRLAEAPFATKDRTQQ